MSSTLAEIATELESIRALSLWKTERPILSPQSSHIEVGDHRKVLNFCANNYLGLADHPALIHAAKEALDSHGLGMASVRFICGTSDLHLGLSAASPTMCRWKMPFSTPPVLMPMAACLNRSLASRMPLFPIL